MAFPLMRRGRRWEAGFCGVHGIVFASIEHEGYTVGEPRRLEDDEALSGPLAPGEGEDQDDDATG